MKNINKIFTSEEDVIKTLFEKGVQNENEIIDILNFLKTLSNLVVEHDMCLSVSSLKPNIETTDDFEILLKNFKSGARYDLKLVLALLTGIELNEFKEVE